MQKVAPIKGKFMAGLRHVETKHLGEYSEETSSK